MAEALKFNEIINVQLSTGATLPLRPYVTQAGTPAHGILAKVDGKYKASGNVPVTPEVIGGKFPEYVTIAGVRVQGKTGITVPYDANKGKKGAAPRMVGGGNPKVSFSTLVNVAGQERRFSLWIIQHGDVYSVGGNINRIPTPKGKAAPATSL